MMNSDPSQLDNLRRLRLAAGPASGDAGADGDAVIALTHLAPPRSVPVIAFWFTYGVDADGRRDPDIQDRVVRSQKLTVTYLRFTLNAAPQSARLSSDSMGIGRAIIALLRGKIRMPFPPIRLA